MTNPHNVDICVTCVSDKPPQLPLREELPSLGIEVVYNAHGIGAKAAKQEQKRQDKLYQKSLEKSRTGKSLFGRGKKREEAEKAKETEHERNAPHALSYASYQMRYLDSQRDGKSKRDRYSHESESSSETNSTAESSGGGRYGRSQGDPASPLSPTMSVGDYRYKPPIEDLEFPSQSVEELAIQEAIKVFADSSLPIGETRDDARDTNKSRTRENTRSTRESREPISKAKAQPTSKRISRMQKRAQDEEDINSMDENTKETSNSPNVSSYKDSNSSSSFSGNKASSVESLGELALTSLSRQSTPLAKSTPTDSSRDEASRPSDEGGHGASKSVKVYRVNNSNNDNTLSEFYDLTEFSEDDDNSQKMNFDPPESGEDETLSSSKDLSTLSSKKDPPEASGFHVYPSSTIKEQLPGLKLRIPEEDDGFGRLVLNLSDVAEDVPGSPVYSPQARDTNVIRSPRKSFSDRMSHIRSLEDHEDNEDIESREDMEFSGDLKRDDPLGQYVDDIGKRGRKVETPYDDPTNYGLSTSHYITSSNKAGKEDPEEDFVFHSPRKSYSEDDGISPHDRHAYTRQSPAVDSSYKDYFLPRASPNNGAMKEDRDPPLSPNLKKTTSRESDFKPSLSVSFSHEVEAHYYYDNENNSDDESKNYSDHGPAYNHREENYNDPTKRREDVNEPKSYPNLFKFVDELQCTAGQSPPGSPARMKDNVDEQFTSILNRSRHENREHRKQQSERKPEPEPSNDNEYDGYFANEENLSNWDLPKTSATMKLPSGSDFYPLHAACSREFPNRFSSDVPCLVKDLVNDVQGLKDSISTLVRMNPDACRHLDKQNDLPVHIISRQLMEWEARWYQKVYERAREDGDEHSGSGSGITTLYQTMSQLVDILLKPLAAEEELCQQPGSTGFLLPLHIAAIFTVSYDTLRSLLEKYPGAARQKCNLGEIRTFIPNFSLPLELHNRLSTDFPKWEIEPNLSDPEHDIQWTQSTIDRSYGTSGGMRRSDLMFAFYPSVAPYRHETPRIRRLESRIRSEVQAIEADEDLELSQAAKLVWEWMCTFEGEDSNDHYIDSVRRIIQTLSAKSIKLLAALPNKAGQPIIETSLPMCAETIRERLEEIALTDVAVPVASLSSSLGSRQRSRFLREWDEIISSRYCLRGRGFVGVLCRTLFNITETSFPTNFVLLPYKLIKDSEGRLGLESPDAAAVAMKFADCLLHLTDPEKILHFLEKKSLRFQTSSLGISKSAGWDRVEEQTKDYVSKLLSLYLQRPAYLYLLDEYTGVPVVPRKGSTYPLVVTDAAETVRKLLPLMISGMIVMRGEKALPVIANVLLNENVSVVHDHWIEAAKDLVGYLYSPQTEWTPSFLQDLRPLRTKLVDFIERGTSEHAPMVGSYGLSSNWVVEVSLLKMLVEMHDPSHSLAGLRARRASLQVLWTCEAEFLDPNSKEHFFHLDFKSLMELKEQSDELDEDSLLARRKKKEEHEVDFEAESEYEADQSSDSDNSNIGYSLLFKELSFRDFDYKDATESEADKNANREVTSHLSKSDDRFIPEPPAIVRRKLRYASLSEPISLLNFDDDLYLDDVLQLRILLDEQEAKLDFLREKVGDLHAAEEELLDEEDRLGNILDTINNTKDLLNMGPSNRGLTSARKLLMRICELEDRVLCREVEVGQLKNDISCFELEAANKDNDLLYDI